MLWVKGGGLGGAELFCTGGGGVKGKDLPLG